MQRITSALTALVMVAAIGAATAIASTSSTSSTTQITTLTLRSQQVTKSLRFVDNAPRGESAGDTVSFSENLYEGSTRVGFSEVTGTLVDSKRHDANNLTGTLILRGGTIALQGTGLGQAPTQHVAIVGGTGAYAGARGEAAITAGRAFSTEQLTFTH
ncbi:MAG: allene oxide cyclase barrel-like domain-containing protein [Solirubrobacteraceae bacterium]